MAVPKRKKSKSKVRMRRGATKHYVGHSCLCPKCGAARESHRVCPSCGYYGDRQVITVEAE